MILRSISELQLPYCHSRAIVHWIRELASRLRPRQECLSYLKGPKDFFTNWRDAYLLRPMVEMLQLHAGKFPLSPRAGACLNAAEPN